MSRSRSLLFLLAVVLVLAGCGGSSKHTSSQSTGGVPAAAEAGLIPGGIPKVVERVEPEVVTVLTPGIGISEAYIPPEQGAVAIGFARLRGHRPGQTVSVELLRDGNRRTVDVRLSSKPQQV